MEPRTSSLKDGRLAVIREAEPLDAGELISFINRVGGESDYLTFGAGGFSLTEAEEAKALSEFQAAENRTYLVAVVEDQIVGTPTFCRRTKGSSASQW